MYEDVAATYKEKAKTFSADVDKAATLSRLSEAGKGVKKTRVPDDENAPLIPRGAIISFKSADASTLRTGAWVFLRRGAQLVVRRFIRAENTPQALLIHVATIQGELEKPVTPGNLLGHIVKVEHQGKSYDPAKRNGGLQALKDYWTDCGTCSAGSKLGRMLSSVLPARMTAGKAKPAPAPSPGAGQ